MITTRNLCIIATLIILGELLYYTTVSIPGDLLYPGKKFWNNMTITLSGSAYNRASRELALTGGLLKTFTSVEARNSADPRLVAIVQEFTRYEVHAMSDMDTAKKQGTNIKAEVQTLCDGLEKQKGLLAQASLSAAASLQPQLLKGLALTQTNLDKAMEW